MPSAFTVAMRAPAPTAAAWLHARCELHDARSGRCHKSVVVRARLHRGRHFHARAEGHGAKGVDFHAEALGLVRVENYHAGGVLVGVVGFGASSCSSVWPALCEQPARRHDEARSMDDNRIFIVCYVFRCGKVRPFAPGCAIFAAVVCIFRGFR